MKNKKKQRIEELAHDYRYQTAPGISTWGPCSDCSLNGARGSGVCRACLVKELLELEQDDLVVLLERASSAQTTHAEALETALKERKPAQDAGALRIKMESAKAAVMNYLHNL